MSKFGVHVVTWNVGKTLPPDDLSVLVGLPESEYVIDILAVGLQEVPWSIFSASGPMAKNNPWLKKLTNVLGKSEFVLLTATQLCSSFLAIFVQRGVLPFISNIESAHTSTGFYGLVGTKGVVSVRFQLHGTWFSFINSHLAAHVWNSLTRVWEYDTILDYHGYSDGSAILDHDYVFWFGDLNFRLEGISRENVDKALRSNNFAELFGYDQLTNLQNKGVIFTDFEESGLYFTPTYKKAIGNPDEFVVQPYRLPSWCDRVLYSSAPIPYSINVLEYTDMPVYTTSDHTPVVLQANVAIPRPASNSLVRFGPVSCESFPSASSAESSIVLSFTFSFANDFLPSERDSIALYNKFFARLDDDIYRWPVKNFLPLFVVRLDLTAEIGQMLTSGFYCLVYHHYEYGQPSSKNSYVTGISDYFPFGDVSSDEDDFGEEADFVDRDDSGDSNDFVLNTDGWPFGEDYEESERENARAGSRTNYRPSTAHHHRRAPPRPKSARGHYDDLSTPGGASGSSSTSFSVTPSTATPSLPQHPADGSPWAASQVNVDAPFDQSFPFDEAHIVDDDGDDDDDEGGFGNGGDDLLDSDEDEQFKV